MRSTRSPSGLPARSATSVIVIEDEPSDDLLDEMEIDDGDTLLRPLSGHAADRTPLGSTAISCPIASCCFRHPIEDDGDGSEDDVFDCIGETLIHELGHYFGMTEEQIDVEEEMWRASGEARR